MKDSSGRWDRSPEVSPTAGGRGGVPGKTLGTELRRPGLRGHLLLQLAFQKKEREACQQHKGRGFQGAQLAEWGWGRWVSGWDLYSLPSKRVKVKFRC